MKPGLDAPSKNVPLSGPIQQIVRNDYGRDPVEDLALGASERVEDGVVERTGNRVLSVGRDAVVYDALLLPSACKPVSISVVIEACMSPSSVLGGRHP